MTHSHNRPSHWMLLTIALFAMLMFAAACGETSDDTIVSSDDTQDDTQDGSQDNAQAAVDDGAAGGASGGETGLSLAGSWELVSLEVDGESVPVPDQPITVDIANGFIDGQAGCNGFSGPIDRGDDGSLTLGPLSQTEMACEDLDFEVAYMSALFGVTTWEGSPDGIAFVSDNARMAYQPRLTAPPATVALTGTVWVLDSIYGPGDGPARAVSSIDTSAPGVELVIEGGVATLRSETCTDTQYEIELSEAEGGGSFSVNGGGAAECEGSEGDNVNHDVASSALVAASGYIVDYDRLTLIGDEGELVDFVASS